MSAHSDDDARLDAWVDAHFDDEVRFLQALVRAHEVVGHRVALDGEAEAFEECRGRLSVRCVVARRRVGRDAHQRLQEADLVVEVRVDPGVEARVVVVVRAHADPLSAARPSRSCRNASTASCMSSAVLDSSGLWLMPAFSPRTNSIACGITSPIFMASWPAPLGMLFVRGGNSGISHNPLETITGDDAQLAVEAFQQLLEQLHHE